MHPPLFATPQPQFGHIAVLRLKNFERCETAEARRRAQEKLNTAVSDKMFEMADAYPGDPSEYFAASHRFDPRVAVVLDGEDAAQYAETTKHMIAFVEDAYEIDNPIGSSKKMRRILDELSSEESRAAFKEAFGLVDKPPRHDDKAKSRHWNRELILLPIGKDGVLTAKNLFSDIMDRLQKQVLLDFISRTKDITDIEA